MRRRSRTARRIKKLLWRVHVPRWVDNQGVLLPTEGPGISPGIRRQIFFSEYEDKEIEIVAKRIGSERVFAYEANPALMELIAATYRANGVAPAVRNVLLAQGEGTREFHVESDFWASSALPGSGSATTISVPQADLNAELRRVRPSFLIADLATVRKICVETHPGMHSNAVLSQMLKGLIAQGFALDFTLMRKNVLYLSR